MGHDAGLEADLDALLARQTAELREVRQDAELLGRKLAGFVE